MNPLLSLRNSEIEKVILTPEEERMAIWGAKFKKWNAERHKEYWDEKEKEVKATTKVQL